MLPNDEKDTIYIPTDFTLPAMLISGRLCTRISGNGTLMDNAKNITLTHKMGLAVIKLPGSATDAKFNSFTPYTGVSGEYRYLLKPSTETPLKGSFIDGGELRGFAIGANIAGGNYKTYTVQ